MPFILLLRLLFVAAILISSRTAECPQSLRIGLVDTPLQCSVFRARQFGAVISVLIGLVSLRWRLSFLPQCCKTCIP